MYKDTIVQLANKVNEAYMAGESVYFDGKDIAEYFQVPIDDVYDDVADLFINMMMDQS